MQKLLLHKSTETGWVLQVNRLLSAFNESPVLFLMALLDRSVLIAVGAASLILHRSPATGIWGWFKCLCIVSLEEGWELQGKLCQMDGTSAKRLGWCGRRIVDAGEWILRDRQHGQGQSTDRAASGFLASEMCCSGRCCWTMETLQCKASAFVGTHWNLSCPNLCVCTDSKELGSFHCHCGDKQL